MSDYSISATITADDSGFQKAIQETIQGLDGFGNAFDSMNNEVKSSFANLANQFNAIDAKSKLWGDSIDVVADKQSALRNEINKLIDSGIAPESQQIQDLKRAYDALGDSGESSGKDIWESFAKLRDIMQGPVELVKLISEGIKKVAESLGELSKEFAEDETASIRFTAAIESSSKMTDGAVGRLGELADALALSSGEAISASQSQIAMLAATGRTEDQIKDMIVAAKGLAVATGVDLDTALTQINQTFSGTAGRLARTTPALKDLTTEELENGDAIKILIDQYGDLSGALEKSSEVSMKNFDNAMGEVKTSIGGVIEEAIKPLRDGATEAMLGFAKWAEEGDNLKTVLEMIAAVGIGIAIAGIVSNIGTAIEAINGLKVAIAALNTTALFGPTGIIIALGLVAAALIGVGNAVHQSALKEVSEEFSSLMSASKMTAEQIYSVQEAMANSSKGEATFEEARDNIKQMASDLGVSEDNVIAIGMASSKVTEEYKRTLTAVQDYNKALQQSNKYIIGTKEWVEAQKAGAISVKETTKAVKENTEATKTGLEWSNKLADQKLDSIKQEKERALDLAKSNKMSVADVAKVSARYDKQILDAYTESVNKQRAISLQDAKDKGASAKTVSDINAYYNNLIVQYKQGQIDSETKLEKEYTNTVEAESEKRRKKTVSDVKDWFSAIGTIGTALEGVIGTDMANFINGVTNIGTNIANVFETGGTSITAWAGLAASLISGVITLFGGSDRAARVSAELAEKAKKAAEEASSALSQVLKSGTSSYETFLGLQQASEYLVKVQDASNKASQSLNTYQRMYSQYYDQYYWDIMRASKGTANVAETQARAAKSAEAMASSYKMEADSARKYAETLEYVNATVYDGNIVTADTSDILAEWADKLDDVVQTYGEASTQVAAMNEYYKKLIYAALYPVADALDKNNAELTKNIGLWKNAANAATAFNTQLSNLRKTASSFYESFGNIGTDIAGSIVDGLTNGLDTAGFMTTMKEYITKMVIQTAVYTDALTSKIAEIGKKIAAALASGVDSSGMSDIVAELAKVYNTAASEASKVSGIVSSAFSASGYATGTNNATRGWHVVGEQGPELAYFGGGERVMNARDTASVMSPASNKSVTVNATFNSPKAMNQYEQMRMLRQYNRDLAFRGAL